MFGIDLWDAGLLPAMVVALIGGLISFASPCVLPIVPPYLAYMGGVSMDEMNSTAQARRRTVLASLFFVLGLSTVFILLGFTASSLGRLFLSNQDWFVTGAGLMVMVFGAHFLGLIRIGIFDREARIDGGDRGGSAFGAFILGLAFAFGWTPCIGPVLGSILALSATEASIGKGILLLSFYSLGLAIPFIFSGYYMSKFLTTRKGFNKYYGIVTKTGGSILLITGILIATNQIQVISYYILTMFPFLTTLG